MIHVRPSSVLPSALRCLRPSKNDIKDSLTSDPKEFEIVNITNNTDIIQDYVCDLSVFDSPLSELRYGVIIDFKSKCDPKHLDIPDINNEHAMIDITSAGAHNEHFIDDNKRVIAHKEFVMDIKPIILMPSTRAEIDAAALLEPRYDYDTSFIWSVRAMQRMQSLGIPWVKASDAVQRLWSFSVQPPIAIMQSDQSLAA